MKSLRIARVTPVKKPHGDLEANSEPSEPEARQTEVKQKITPKPQNEKRADVPTSGKSHCI